MIMQVIKNQNYRKWGEGIKIQVRPWDNKTTYLENVRVIEP